MSPESALSPESVLSHAARWYARSGIQEPSGGVARYYRTDLERNHPVSTEITGYVISALREARGVTTAINVSAAIRVFCHFYQGAAGVIAITPMALLFAYWYAHSRRLWPLIVAHAIVDLAGLVPYLT